MNLFPFFEDMENKKVLVIGGGKVAAGKIEKLLEFTAKITVISPDFSGVEDIRRSEKGKQIRWIQRQFWNQDVEEADVVIGAADDHALHARIAKLCREHHIPVNIVDDPSLCTFMFPALICRGDLTIGISSNGKSPAAVAYVRQLIEKALPDSIGEIISRMGQMRPEILSEVPDQKERTALFREILGMLLETDGKAEDARIREKITSCVEEIKAREEVEKEAAEEETEEETEEKELEADPNAPKEDIYVAKPWMEEDPEEEKRVFRLAARGSALSKAQACLVQEMLEKQGVKTGIVTVVTEGDRQKDVPLAEIGGKGLFVKEVEKKLLDNEADIAVHSAKDLPRETETGLVIGGLPEMADPRDCLVFREGTDLSGPVMVGTGSRRRIMELQNLFPSMRFKNLRGNVDTRLQKLRSGEYDAVVLAKAGLERLKPDLTGLQMRVLEVEECIPAPCQGMLALECRKEDLETQDVLKSITDEWAFRRFTVERYLMELMQADCHEAFGVFVQLFHEDISISAMYKGKHATIRGRYESYKILCEEVKIALSE